jgi:uncharacterized membrane protein (TIGR02234 family)
MRNRAEFALALILDLLGAAGALLVGMRAWQTIVTPRPRPLADDVLRISGRTIDSAGTALGLVALAGVVAVLATRGLARRVIGVVLGLAGAALVWRSLTGLTEVSVARARTLVASKHSAVGVDAAVVPHVTVHEIWPLLSTACGVVVLLAGALIALRGHTWLAMSTRYESPSGQYPTSDEDEARRTRADATMWTALDRGDDPTDASDPDRS